MTDHGQVPSGAVLAAFEVDAGSVAPLPGGLINRSFVAHRHGKRVVLQRVSEIFGRGLNADLAAVTAHLAMKGLLTPRLLPTREGSTAFEDSSGRWRVWTFIDGVAFDALQSPQQAERAASLVADFHQALSDFERPFQAPRLGVHDTAAHLERLRSALNEHGDHRCYAPIAALARDVLETSAALPTVPATPERVVHGDLKISNMLFDRVSGAALCLIDLDTVSRMPLPLELGDAMRSWCNPSGEDAAAAQFRLDYFQAAMRGYASRAPSFITAAEWRAVLPATLLITVELAARFCTDALTESYFGWDRGRFASASEHNQARARGQLALASSLKRQYKAARATLETAFGR